MGVEKRVQVGHFGVAGGREHVDLGLRRKQVEGSVGRAEIDDKKAVDAELPVVLERGLKPDRLVPHHHECANFLAIVGDRTVVDARQLCGAHQGSL